MTARQATTKPETEIIQPRTTSGGLVVPKSASQTVNSKLTITFDLSDKGKSDFHTMLEDASRPIGADSVSPAETIREIGQAAHRKIWPSDKSW